MYVCVIVSVFVLLSESVCMAVYVCEVFVYVCTKFECM